MILTNCEFGNPKWILKSGEIRTLEPLESAGTNANFQFSSSTCYTNYENSASSTAGFSYGEILTNYFLFIIMVAMITGFFINKFIIYRK